MDNESYAYDEPNSSQSQNESADEDNECPDIPQSVKTPENPQRNGEPTERQDQTIRPDILQRAISEAQLNRNDDLQDHWDNGVVIEEHEYEKAFPKPIIDPVPEPESESEPEEESTPAPPAYLNGDLDSALIHLETIKSLRQFGQEWGLMHEKKLRNRLYEMGDTEIVLERQLADLTDFDSVRQFARDNNIVENDQVRGKLLRIAAANDITCPDHHLTLQQLIEHIGQSMNYNLRINPPARQQNNESVPDRPREVNRVVPMETDEDEHEPIRDENPDSGISQGSINFSKFQPLTENRSQKVSQMIGRGDNTVSDSKQHRCGECGRTFTQSIGLQGHLDSMHSKIRFTCPYCEHTLCYANSLARHKQTCKKRPTISTDKTSNGFQCSKCSKVFQSSRGLKCHITSVHSSKPKSSVCPVCKSTFPNKTALNKHKKETGCGKKQ